MKKVTSENFNDKKHVFFFKKIRCKSIILGKEKNGINEEDNASCVSGDNAKAETSTFNGEEMFTDTKKIVQFLFDNGFFESFTNRGRDFGHYLVFKHENLPFKKLGK